MEPASLRASAWGFIAIHVDSAWLFQRLHFAE